jgi:hypothetical protein
LRRMRIIFCNHLRHLRWGWLASPWRVGFMRSHLLRPLHKGNHFLTY